MPVRDQNQQRRIDDLQQQVNDLAAEVRALRERREVVIQTPRIGRTADIDNYPEQGAADDEEQRPLLPIEFLDSGHSGSVGWDTIKQEKRQDPGEDYSVVAAHLSRRWLQKKTLVACFRQPALNDIDDDWFVIPIGGTGPAIGVLEADVGHNQIGRMKLTEQRKRGPAIWRTPAEWLEVLNITHETLEAGATGAATPSDEPLMFAFWCESYDMPIVFPEQLEKCVDELVSTTS